MYVNHAFSFALIALRFTLAIAQKQPKEYQHLSKQNREINSANISSKTNTCVLADQVALCVSHNAMQKATCSGDDLDCQCTWAAQLTSCYSPCSGVKEFADAMFASKGNQDTICSQAAKYGKIARDKEKQKQEDKKRKKNGYPPFSANQTPTSHPRNINDVVEQNHEVSEEDSQIRSIDNKGEVPTGRIEAGDNAIDVLSEAEGNGSSNKGKLPNGSGGSNWITKSGSGGGKSNGKTVKGQPGLDGKGRNGNQKAVPSFTDSSNSSNGNMVVSSHVISAIAFAASCAMIAL